MSETDITPDNPLAVEPPVTEAEPFYTGSWERAGRNPSFAGILVLFGVGAIYFNAQMLLSVPMIVISRLSSPHAEGGTFIETISQTMREIALPIQIALFISQFAFMLAPTLYFLKRLHTKRFKEYLRLGRLPVLDVFLAVLITFAMMPFTTYIANVLTKWMDVPDWIANLGIELFTAHSFPEFLWLALVIGVTPAICEEVLFRGYAQRTLERNMGSKSVWIAGVLFGLYHMQPLGLISLAIMGVVFGFFFYRSKSLFPSMAAHFTNNFFIVWLLYSGVRIGGVDLAAIDDVPVLWALGSVVVSGGLLYLFYLATKNREDVATLTPDPKLTIEH